MRYASGYLCESRFALTHLRVAQVVVGVQLLDVDDDLAHAALAADRSALTAMSPAMPFVVPSAVLASWPNSFSETS